MAKKGIHEHVELSHLLYDFNHLYSLPEQNNADDVWLQIINDIQKYNTELAHCISEEKPICPLIQSERPDVIYVSADYVMGIECFSFDASKKTRKGSKQLQKEQAAEREILAEYRQSEKPDNGFLSIERTVNVEFSVQEYYNSLSIAFKQHAKQIPEYRKNLKRAYPCKQIYLSFFIEDITAIGNYVITKGQRESLSPLRIPQFLFELIQVKDLDYVVIKTTDTYVPKYRFQALTKEDIIKLCKDCYGPDTKYIQYQYKRESHFYN